MSDKKKKMITTKEPGTPKRPVILKSEREVLKEPPKEKVDKEKQPTIILKTREQSAPKEEPPQSPQPTKIVQNENKEKKVGDSKGDHQTKPMLESVKLLDENLEFNNAALEFLQDSSTNYLVVGIVGTQGVGKSTIMNLIAANSPNDTSSKIVHSHEPEDETPSDSYDIRIELSRSKEKKQEFEQKENFFKFKMQDIEHIETGIHCTKGIDMFVTNDRVILLDCRPLWSPSLIDDSGSAATRSANVITVDCLQIASFLMAICHVLIAVQDWFTDYNFIRYLQAAEMLKPTLSAPPSLATADCVESTNDCENLPHLLLLHNRCQLEDFTAESVNAMKNLYRKAFQNSGLQLKSGMYVYSDLKRACSNATNYIDNNNEMGGPPINLCLLPELCEEYDSKHLFNGYASFEDIASRLRWMVLGAHRHQITNLSNLSERGWFYYCNRSWETIRKSTFYMEYERFLP